LIGQIWDLIALQPVMNMLIVLTHYLFSSFGLAIIALTIVVNILMYPLTKKQLHATQAMQSLQPKLSELQKKYGKDRQRLAQEQMRLYKESGVNPAGCLMPMLIQLPIWIALYQSIIRVLAWTPEDFLGLSRYLYSWQVVYSSLPLADKFLWFSLAVPDAVLAVLVMITMWLQQKMVTPPTTDPKQQSMSRMMLWTMPLMFGFLCLSFPSGLALFWVTSSVIRIAMQYFATGWGGVASSMATKLAVRDKRLKYRIAAQEAAAEADIVDPGSEEEEGLDYEESGGERQDRGGGYSASLRAIRRQPRRGRSHRRKRR
jgi:YidC/Oxa1 family membrane protein insertase